MSERKGEEMPIFFANPRKDQIRLIPQFADSLAQRDCDHVLAHKAYGQYRLTPVIFASIKREKFGVNVDDTAELRLVVSNQSRTE